MRLPAQTLACYSPRPPLPIWWLRWWRNCPQQPIWPFQSLTRGKNDTALHAKSKNWQAAAVDGRLSGAIANKPVSFRHEAWGLGCCLSTWCFGFQVNLSQREKNCPLRFVTWSVCYQMAQISCHYWISASSLHFIAPIPILCLHMVFQAELDDGQSW